jgi:hypothetical protein
MAEVLVYAENRQEWRQGLDRIFPIGYIPDMECEMVVTDEFRRWWDSLSVPEQESVAHDVDILKEKGVDLRFPRSSGVTGSKHGHIRELRIQHEGRPYRVLYAFDPSRSAILLIGGDKTGEPRWYQSWVPVADRLYDEHLKELEREKVARDRS